MPPCRANARNVNARDANAAPPVPVPEQSGSCSCECKWWISSSGGQHQNRLYAFQARQDQEGSPDVVTAHVEEENKELVKDVHRLARLGVCLMSISDNADFNTLVNLVVALEKEGTSVFRFDFPEMGKLLYGNYRREANDLHSVVEYFNGANRKVAAVLGHSKGGNDVLLYASKYHDVHTVINLSGRYNLEKGITRRLGKDFLEVIKKDSFIDVKNIAAKYMISLFVGNVDYRVTEESLMDRLNTNMHDACLQIDKGCRVLTVHGSADEIIPVEDALEFDEIIPNHKLHISEGANHCYTSHQAELTPVILPFIKEGLQH
nr:uncharacterized protein LOC101258280 [Solanum lycopersicum]